MYRCRGAEAARQVSVAAETAFISLRRGGRCIGRPDWQPQSHCRTARWLLSSSILSRCPAYASTRSSDVSTGRRRAVTSLKQSRWGVQKLSEQPNCGWWQMLLADWASLQNLGHGAAERPEGLGTEVHRASSPKSGEGSSIRPSRSNARRRAPRGCPESAHRAACPDAAPAPRDSGRRRASLPTDGKALHRRHVMPHTRTLAAFRSFSSVWMSVCVKSFRR